MKKAEEILLAGISAMADKMMILTSEEIKKVLAPQEKVCKFCGKTYTVADYNSHQAVCYRYAEEKHREEIKAGELKKLKRKQKIQGIRQWAETFFEGNK